MKMIYPSQVHEDKVIVVDSQNLAMSKEAISKLVFPDPQTTLEQQEGSENALQFKIVNPRKGMPGTLLIGLGAITDRKKVYKIPLCKIANGNIDHICLECGCCVAAIQACINEHKERGAV